MSPNEQEPDVDIRRDILEQKLALFRSQGFEANINYEVSVAIGNKPSELKWKKDTRDFYKSAARVAEMLAELPEEEKKEEEEEEQEDG